MIEPRWFTSNKSKKVFHLVFLGRDNAPVDISQGMLVEHEPCQKHHLSAVFYRMEGSPLTGREESSYRHHGAEWEYMGMAKEINPCFNICMLLCAVVYGYLRSCRRYGPMLILCSSASSLLQSTTALKKCEMRCFFTDNPEPSPNTMNNKQLQKKQKYILFLLVFNKQHPLLFNTGQRAVNIHCSSQEVTKHWGMWLLHIPVYKLDYMVIQLHGNSI